MISSTNSALRLPVPILPVMQGACAGLLATVPMSLAMRILRAEALPGKKHEYPFKLVANGVARKMGFRASLNPSQNAAYQWASHFAFGATMGGIFSLLPRGKSVRTQVLIGAAFGGAVWGTSYVAALPAAGLQPPPTAKENKRLLIEIASHLVFGAALGILVPSKRDSFAFDRLGPSIPSAARSA